MQTNRYAASRAYLNEGLGLSEKIGNNVRHSIALYYIGNWYAQQGNLTGAMPYYTKAFEESLALEMLSSNTKKRKINPVPFYARSRRGFEQRAHNFPHPEPLRAFD